MRAPRVCMRSCIRSTEKTLELKRADKYKIKRFVVSRKESDVMLIRVHPGTAARKIR